MVVGLRSWALWSGLDQAMVQLPAWWKTNAYAPWPVWIWLKPRRGPTGEGGADLRSADQPAHPGHVPHPGDYPRRRSADELLLQIQPDQTVLQGAQGVAHRDSSLRHPRLRHRAAGHRRQLESPSGGWRF